MADSAEFKQASEDVCNLNKTLSNKEFKQAAEDVRNLNKTPSNEDYAKIYSLYKQATDGDCGKAKPGVTEILAKAKYDAWSARKGMSKSDAAQQYIAAAKEAVTKYGKK